MVYGSLFSRLPIYLGMTESNFVGKCNHTTRITQLFIDTVNKQFPDAKIDKQAVLDELKICGGYCDCEIVHNAADQIDWNDPMPKME